MTKPGRALIDTGALLAVTNPRGRKIEGHLSRPDADLHAPELCDVELLEG